jgi:Xaa-Pro aminopeptidase
VYDAQRAAIRSVRPGVSGAELQRKTQETFAAAGYETGEKDGVMQGFFHGLGHGLGLDLHELPRLSAATFAPGNVFTIEPGLYYPEIGGVRIEDDVVVTTTGRKILGPALACPLEL